MPDARLLAPALAVTTALVTLAADPASGQAPPHTLNFANETAERIEQTVPEQSGNIKDVEHADFDQDGDLDVAMAIAGGVFGERRNKLYRNDDGVLVEVSGAPIISGFSALDLSRHVFFRDYDGDGWLDILIVNDLLAGGGPLKLYMNKHPEGVFSHFVDEGFARGLDYEASCGAISEDVDQDGDYDIYSGNYPSPSQDTLYLNDGTGHFARVTSTHVPPDGDYTIDVAAADMNGDGKIDLLISNHSTNYTYYNDLQELGDQGVGDYRYGSGGYQGRQSLGSASSDGAMEPADFNGDGRVDFYWTNKVGSTGDRILVNTGNGADGKAIFTEVMPPAYGTASSGNKITAGDLNADGRVDLVIGVDGFSGGRPAVFRNTSVGGAVSFVDWTPASAFPTGSALRGSEADILDVDGDGRLDVLVGGNANDHLFTGNAGTVVDEDDLSGGTLPPVHNADAVAVIGHGSTKAPDEFVANGIGSGAFISAIVNGDDDYRLEVLNGSGSVMASSDRGGLGIEEALQTGSLSAGSYTIRVTVLEAAPLAADVDGDGTVAVSDLLAVLSAWGACGGCPADIDGNGAVDVQDLLAVLGAWGTSHDYVLEVLARTG